MKNVTDVTGLENVARADLGAIAIADTEDFVESEYIQRKGGQVKFVNDGATLTSSPNSGRWFSEPCTPHPHWVWLRFRQPASSNKVVIHRGSLEYYPVDFSGQYSTDGGLTFQEIFKVTDNKMDSDTLMLECSFDNIVTDNFRLWIDKSSSQRFPAETELTEIEVFGQFVDGETGDVETATAQTPEPSFEPTLAPTSEQYLQIEIEPDKPHIEFHSPWLRLAVDRDQPRIAEICWDGLGDGKVNANFLTVGEKDGGQLVAMPLFSDLKFAKASPAQRQGNVIRYNLEFSDGVKGLWEIRVRAKSIDMNFSWTAGAQTAFKMPLSLKFAFDSKTTFVAPLVNPVPGDTAPLPALLHVADYGSMLVETASDAPASVKARGQWFDTFNATILDNTHRRADGLHILPEGISSWAMTLNVETVNPLPELTSEDQRLRFLPRHWLNGFQYRPDWGILCNNVVSANAIPCLYTYTDPAVYTPPLPGNIEAIQVARESVDRYLNGFGGYGDDVDYFTSSYPALIISAWNVILVTGDFELLHRWLPQLERIADHIISQDSTGNGLPESTRSGNRLNPNPDDWRSGNWWDCINFGHEDGYSCVLAYRAFRCMDDLERLADRSEQAKHYTTAADRIRQVYVPTFLNPETGILAGWKSLDGQLHDYWFLSINAMAITYGLVDDDLANQILDKFEAKLKEVGYSRFDLGLPDNLVAIPKDEYASPHSVLKLHQVYKGDTFGLFENGGATACQTYYYIQALYQLGRRDQANRILWPMLKTYAVGGFQNGAGHGGEWRFWDGSPSGYEGFLADSYKAQMALYTGYYGIGFGLDGFYLEPFSSLKGQQVKLGLKHMGRIVEAIT